LFEGLREKLPLLLRAYINTVNAEAMLLHAIKDGGEVVDSVELIRDGTEHEAAEDLVFQSASLFRSVGEWSGCVRGHGCSVCVALDTAFGFVVNAPTAPSPPGHILLKRVHVSESVLTGMH
jgi:hypothetical protein